MLIVVTFLLGVANFALHRAVLASRHPLFEGSSGDFLHGAGRITLMLEFAMLLAALAFAFQEAGWATGAYALYSAANGIAAWLILTRRL